MKAQLYYPLKVVAGTLHVQVQEVPCVIVKEDNKHEEHADGEAELTQSPDSKLQTSDHRHGSASSDTPNYYDLVDR